MVLKLKRFLALYIDFMIIFFAVYTPVYIVNKAIELKSLGTAFEIGISIIMVLIFWILLIRKDLVFKNASIGKKLLGLSIYYKDGNTLTKEVLIKRNRSLLPLFPLDIVSIILRNETSGDKKYNTKVDFVQK